MLPLKSDDMALHPDPIRVTRVYETLQVVFKHCEQLSIPKKKKSGCF